MTRRLVQVALVALCLAVYAVPTSAQVFTGRIDVTVKDATGAVLPGVAVQITGVQDANTVTDARGQARFLSLAPGRYVVTATLTGFNAYRNDNVAVGAGSEIVLTVTLTIGTLTAETTVVAETPVIEARRATVQTNVSLDELQNIPTSRDPWVILQTVPGIIVDRVNVGGAESGQQSNFQAKGAGRGDATWNMDGIAITDMAALGASPTYYDFDMFQEMQVTTGGADVKNVTGGVHLNFVLRSGTNRYRGSTRYYFENDDMQADNVSTSLATQITSYNRVKQYTDWGFEGGGPIAKDRLWVWAAYGETTPDMKIFTYNASQAKYLQTAIDKTILKNTSFKATGEMSGTRASFTFFRGDKLKFGRGAGATRPDETTWNQAGPTNFYKGEASRTFGSAMFLTGRYAYVGGGFGLTPRGGLGTSPYLDDSGVWHGSFLFYKTDRPQHNVQFDGNYFMHAAGTDHELKFGFGWRKATVTSASGWGGGGYTVHTGYPSLLLVAVRDWASAGEGIYMSGYIGDTFTRGKVTVNAGVRWDRSTSSILPASTPANPVFPTTLPALTAKAVDNAVVWNSVTPRAGVAYALTDKTLLRGSYSMFASQLNAVQGSSISSAIPYYSYAYYAGTDANGNNRLDASEATTFLGTAGFDPTNPLGGNPDKIGSYKVPLTHEFILGADHELRRNFGVSGAVTWRRYSNFNWLHTKGVTGRNYTQIGTLTGNVAPVGPHNIPLYGVDASKVPSNRERVWEDRDGYSQRYWGVEISATKRMSDNWMMRMGWSTGAHREYFDGLEAMGDPTPSPAAPNRDGGVVMTQTSGSGKSSIYLVQPKYQYILTLAYQAKWGINAGFNYLFRQGYAMPFFRSRVSAAADILSPGGKSVLVIPDVDEYRLPNVHSVDGRISKALTFDRVNVHVDFDLFNMFNTSTTLGRQFDLRLSTFNRILEITNPRILRIGLRVQFD